MAKIQWDGTGERRYETGVSHGVLYPRDEAGTYTDGVAWNGLTAVTESPSGAEPNKQYADNIVYVTLVSAEEFAATIEAFTYPDEFEEMDGSVQPVEGVSFGQQTRKTFGFSYQTLVGDDVQGQEAGYKIHIVWGALAAPSEKAYATVNDSPEAMTFSWEVSTTPIAVDGYKPTASATIDSTKVTAAQLKAVEDILYGTTAEEPRLPLPGELITLLTSTVEP